MGDTVRRKLYNETKMVTFDFAAPELAVGKPNRDQFGYKAAQECCRILIRSLVGAKYPQGMDRKAGKYWAAWLEVMDEDEPPNSVEMPFGQFEWLKKIVDEEGLNLDWRLAQWREALAEYMSSIKPPEDDGLKVV